MLLKQDPTIHPAAVALALLLHGGACVALLHWRQTTQPPPAAFSIELPLSAVTSDDVDAVDAPPPDPETSPQQPAAAEEPPVAVDAPAAEPSPPEPPLAVPAMTALQSNPPAAVRPPLPPAPPPRRAIATPRLKAAPAQPEQAAPAAGSAIAVSEPTPATQPSDRSWQRGLGAWLVGHRAYPDAARRGGVQGTVTVRVAIARDGAVTAVALVHTSGSDLLDDAAVAMLRDARVPAFPPSMPQPGVTVTVPIHYVLER